MTDTVQASANVLAYSEKTTALTDAQKALIDQPKGIKVSVEDLTISAKSAPDGKDHSVKFLRVTAIHTAAVMKLAENDVDKEDSDLDTAEKVLVRYFNDGYNRKRFSLVRQKLANEVEGPAKKLESAARMLVKTGLPQYDTFEKAMAHVSAQKEKAEAAQ